MSLPSITEVITAVISDKKFLLNAILLPKYLDSNGIVANPTIMSVDMNTAACVYPAPACISDAARGKATYPGISVMHPMAAAIAMPFTPELSPIISDMTASSTTESISPTIRSIESIEGRIFSNDLQAFFKALSALLRSL